MKSRDLKTLTQLSIAIAGGLLLQAAALPSHAAPDRYRRCWRPSVSRGLARSNSWQRPGPLDDFKPVEYHLFR